MKDRHYIMELDEAQYNHIAMCVEVCHRIACGDLLELQMILPMNADMETLQEIKRQSFPELSLGEIYGWEGGYRNDERGEDYRKVFDTFQAQGYQIYREMLHTLAKSKKLDNVYSSPTLETNKAKKPIVKETRNGFCVDDAVVFDADKQGIVLELREDTAIVICGLSFAERKYTELKHLNE